MMANEVDYEALKQVLREDFQKIDEVQLFYELKKLGIPYFFPREVLRQVIKAVYVLQKHGISPTSTAICWLIKKEYSPSILHTLHGLGDKGILLIQPKLTTIKRGGSYVWHLHPIVYNICARLAGEEEIEEELEEMGEAP